MDGKLRNRYQCEESTSMAGLPQTVKNMEVYSEQVHQNPAVSCDSRNCTALLVQHMDTHWETDTAAGWYIHQHAKNGTKHLLAKSYNKWGSIWTSAQSITDNCKKKARAGWTLHTTPRRNSSQPCTMGTNPWSTKRRGPKPWLHRHTIQRLWPWKSWGTQWTTEMSGGTSFHRFDLPVVQSESKFNLYCEICYVHNVS